MSEKSFKIDGGPDSDPLDFYFTADNDDSTEDVIITDEVVAIVAGQAALDTDFVASMSSTVAGNIAESLGLKNPTKGVTVRTDDGKVILDLYVVVRYGSRISDVAWNIQENVKKEVENMTGAVVDAVNIHITGVDFSQKPKKKA
ncbi:MAG: Asp23/Gls24 family envelope stress response protein [Clostridia bacterium]|nr:Asp23/Gls24 family envelope stress response protein [Clostridia bacterium]